MHPISGKTCVDAWLKAVTLLSGIRSRTAYTVILEIEHPITMTAVDRRITERVDGFLKSHEAQPIATVAGTIFPASYYQRRGATGVFEDFLKVYPKMKKHWGTYAGRMLSRSGKHAQEINPLEIIIGKLKQQTRRKGALRAIYELGTIDVFADLPIYEPSTDARLTLNQPCLSHLSFKLREDHGLMLTALYRSHYYVERALGNLIGLSQLLFFVAKESGLEPRGLVCHSTYAKLDMDGGWSVGNLKRLIAECNELARNGQGEVTKKSVGA